MSKFLGIAVLCWCVMSFSVSALTMHKNLSALTPTQGPKVTGINHQLITSDGFLWLGTEQGLYRYDGYQMVAISGPNHVFISQPIVYLFEDSHGFLWISDANSGLYRLNLATGKYQKLLDENLADELKDVVQVDFIVEQDNGDVWLASTQNLRHYQRKTGQMSVVYHFTTNDDVSIVVNTLLLAQQTLYIGTNNGLFTLDINNLLAADNSHAQVPERVDHTDVNNPLSRQLDIKTLNLMSNDLSSSLAVGTGAGLYELKLERNTLKPLSSVSAIEALAKHRIWQVIPYEGQYLIATSQGLWRYAYASKGVKQLWQFSDDASLKLNDDNIVNIVMDAQNNFWLASRNKSSYYWDPEPTTFQSIEQQTCDVPGLTNTQVWSVLPADNNILWVGTRNGLNKVDLSSGAVSNYMNLPQADLMSTSMIFKIMKASSSQLLLSTANPSESLLLFDIDTQTSKPLLMADELTEEVMSEPLAGFHYDKQGHLWFASESDFYRYDSHTGKALILPNLIDEIDVESLAGFLGFLPSRPHQMMIATFLQLWLYDVRSGTAQLVFSLNEDQVDDDYSITSWLVDEQQILWLTMPGYGLVGLDSQTFELKHHFNQHNQLPTNFVYGVQLDSEGFLWLSSDKGLLRMHVQEDVNKDIKVGQLHVFTQVDGLITNEFNGGVGVNAHGQLPDGRLVYGSNKGVTLFDPSMLSNSQVADFEVKITNVSLLSRQLELSPIALSGQSIELDHNDKGLQINFSTMRFSRQNQVQYSWSFDNKTMVNFPENGNNSIMLPEITPGSYVFNVMAVDTVTGVKSDSQSIAIIVNPPWWASKWAYFIYALIAMILVWRRWRQYQSYMQLVESHHSALQEMHGHVEQHEGWRTVALNCGHSGVWDWHGDKDKLEDIRVHEALKDLDVTSLVTLEQHRALIHGDDLDAYQRAWAQLINGQQEKLDIVFRMKNAQGQWLWYHDVAMITSKRAGKALWISGLYTDVTKQKRAEQALMQHNQQDNLTGLLNRQELFTRLAEQIAQCREQQSQLAVLFIDIDNVKQINRNYGFLVADKILQQLALELAHYADENKLLARVASEQFILTVSPYQDQQSIEDLAKQIVQTCAKPMLIETHEVLLTLSIGIALYPHDNAHNSGHLEQHSLTESLVTAAHLAMVQAQSLGDNQVQIYDDKMHR